MWKSIFGLFGLLVGAFAGLELIAWFFYSGFDAGGTVGMILGAPIGAVVGCTVGVIIGWRADRRNFSITQLRPRHVSIAIVPIAICAIVLVWMSRIRPFFWIQT